MSSPIIEYEDFVRPEWINSNGHMNLAYYVVVFDLATDKLYAALGIGDAYRDATGNSCFTAETHTVYEREVHHGDQLARSYLVAGIRLESACTTSMNSFTSKAVNDPRCRS